MHQLRRIDTAALVALLQPHVRIRVILDFQEKLNKWKIVTPPKKKIDLLDILKTQPVGLNMLAADHLSDNNRKLLVEMIVNHFVRHKLTLTQEARDDMAQQIVNRFPQENPVSGQLISSINVSRLFGFQKIRMKGFGFQNCIHPMENDEFQAIFIGNL